MIGRPVLEQSDGETCSIEDGRASVAGRKLLEVTLDIGCILLESFEVDRLRVEDDECGVCAGSFSIVNSRFSIVN